MRLDDLGDRPPHRQEPPHHPQLPERGHHPRRAQLAQPDSFDPFLDYVSARLVEDPHLWARTLCDELEDLGYTLSYPTLTRQIRERKLRPVCQVCATATDRPNAVIEHPPGAETQWDWVDLPNPPASWGWGSAATSARKFTACGRRGRQSKDVPSRNEADSPAPVGVHQ
jgi:hypothetical protein